MSINKLEQAVEEAIKALQQVDAEPAIIGSEVLALRKSSLEKVFSFLSTPPYLQRYAPIQSFRKLRDSRQDIERDGFVYGSRAREEYLEKDNFQALHFTHVRSERETSQMYLSVLLYNDKIWEPEKCFFTLFYDQEKNQLRVGYTPSNYCLGRPVPSTSLTEGTIKEIRERPDVFLRYALRFNLSQELSIEDLAKITPDESRHPLFQCFMKGFIRITQIALESEKEQQKKLYTEATDLQK